jgi:hypothetical protein
MRKMRLSVKTGTSAVMGTIANCFPDKPEIQLFQVVGSRRKNKKKRLKTDYYILEFSRECCIFINYRWPLETGPGNQMS